MDNAAFKGRATKNQYCCRSEFSNGFFFRTGSRKISSWHNHIAQIRTENSDQETVKYA